MPVSSLHSRCHVSVGWRCEGQIKPVHCQELKKLLQEKKELRRGDGSPLALEAVKEAYQFISLRPTAASFTPPCVAWLPSTVCWR